jgi:hypothetical protein
VLEGWGSHSVLIQRCACVGLCVAFDGSKMRNSSTKSNCHHRMNRHPVGSSVETSGEGVWALSCSLLANFAPSDEPTPSRLLTIGSSGAEEIFLSSQTRAQLLQRVKSIGRRTIRWLVSPKSRSAPTVRPTLLFFNRRFIRRYTGVWVLPVISVGGCWGIKDVSLYDPQAYGPHTFFTTGFPRFLSIRGARGLQAFDQQRHTSY